MSNRKFLRVLTLCLVLAFVAAVFVDEAYAQAKPAAGKGAAPAAGGKGAMPAGKNSTMEKKGIEGLFAGKGGADPRSPTPTQKWIGVGSIGVMIIVVKYL